MDVLSGITGCLGENEPTISGVAAVLAIAVIVFTGLSFLLSRRPRPTPETPTETSAQDDPLLALPTGPVVAVFPFANLSRDPATSSTSATA
jgi:hypothetical protein